MFRMQVNQDIHIRLLMKKDAAMILSVLQENQEHLQEWLIWAVQLPTVDVYERDIIPTWLQKFADEQGFEAGLFYKEKFVGMIGLRFIDRTNNATEIGYWLSKEYEGHGIMTKAVQHVVQYCFTELDLHRVLIRAATGNEKSRAIPKRLGFVEEGTERAAQYMQGQYYDVVQYSLLRTDERDSLT